MPGRDRTGPNGDYVNCTPTEYNSVSNGIFFGFGRGFGRDRGFGGEAIYNPRGEIRPRFLRGRTMRALTSEEELDLLKKQKENLNTRIEELEKKSFKKS
jgi:hypothetical protein